MSFKSVLCIFACLNLRHVSSQSSIPDCDTEVNLVAFEPFTFKEPTEDFENIYFDEDNSLDFYFGEVKLGKMSGYGNLTWKNGHQYAGYFRNGMMHGRGIYYWPDGGVFDGLWFRDDRQGYGVYTYGPGPDEGDKEIKFYVSNSVANGYGHFEFANGDTLRGYVYEKNWDLDYARICYKDNGKYEGSLDNSFQRHGFGSMEYENGSVYTGPWCHGHPSDCFLDTEYDIRYDFNADSSFEGVL